MDLKTRRDLLRCYYANGNSPIAAIRAFCTENGNCQHPCNPTTVSKLVQRFEETFSLHDKPRKAEEVRRKNAVVSSKEPFMTPMALVAPRQYEKWL